MKKYLFIILTLAISSVSIFAQNNDFEVWAKQKHDEYDKWKKMRADIISHLPSNPKMDAISNFIDQGFEPAPAESPVPSTTVTPGNSTAPTNSASSGNSSVTPSSQIPVQHATFKVWVVIVGVAYYPIENMRLKYTDDDAYKVYAFYKSPEGGSLPDSQIALLVDEDATRSNVLQAINDMYNKAGQNDVIIFYFSGHGSNSAFITADYDQNTYNNKGLLLHSELNGIFEKSKARYKYIITDACHSGNMAIGINNSKGSFYEAFEQSKGGLAMLLSSMGSEYSIEASNKRQGIFSYYLIQGLKGEADKNRDGIVTITELYDYVEMNVKNYTQNKQNPVLAGKYDEKMPVSVIR